MSETAAPVSAPAPHVAIRARPPSPKRLSRKVLLAGAAAMGAIVVFALANGLSERPDRATSAESEAAGAAAGPPDSIRLASPNYGAGDLSIDEFAAGDEPPLADLAPPEDVAWTGAPATAPASAGGPTPVDPEALARTAPILFADATARPDAGGARQNSSLGRHSAFLSAQSDAGERLERRLTPPRSAYEIMAGAVIPAALQTELNSDLPGRVIAQVTAPVFDTVTGRHLLIPQGARLIGAYDSATTYGDHRLLLVWNRLILPNGWSINLEGMEGGDASGAAGVRDRTDNHLDRLAGAIGLSAIISVVANEAEDDDRQNLVRSVGDAAAQEAARSGGRLVDRELSVRPTLRVRAGAPVRVLVTSDIRLRPYRQ